MRFYEAGDERRGDITRAYIESGSVNIEKTSLLPDRN